MSFFRAVVPMRCKHQMLIKLLGSKFGVHHFWGSLKCSYHGDGSMRVEGKESICEQCESMPDEKRANLKGGIPKVTQVKLRIMLMEPLNEFLSPGGTYET